MIALAALLLLGAFQDDIDAKLKDFAEAMKAAKSEAEQIGAIQALAATKHLKAAQKITAVLASPGPAGVRVAAADAVGKVGDPKAGPGLQAVLSSFGGLLSSENPNRADDQKVAEAVVRALGTLRDRSSTRMLTGLLISNNIALMGEAVRTLGKLRDPSCLEGLLKLHYAANAPEGVGATNPRKPLAPDTLAALRRITGQKLTTPDEWNKWYKSAGRAFMPPPEESLGGLAEEVQSFAVYSGKGEAAALLKYDLVLVDPAGYSKEELVRMKAIALSGDLKAALDKGCLGAVIDRAQAAELRKKFPRALLVVKGDPISAAPYINAALIEGLDPKKPDATLLAGLKDVVSRHNTAILCVFVAPKKEDLAAAAKFAKDNGFRCYAAPAADCSTLPAAP
jgi:hypothetical protein